MHTFIEDEHDFPENPQFDFLNSLQEVLSSGSEKERDCSLSRFNTYRIGLQSEQNFFNQEVGADLNYVSQVFLVEQIQFHRKMAEKLEGLYHECWPTDGDQSHQGKSK